VAENTIFGTQQEVWKVGLLEKSVLEENIRTVAVITNGSRRLLALDFISSQPNDKRVEQFSDYLLEN